MPSEIHDGPTEETADAWLATLAHELRTPLHSVVLALRAMQRACEGDANARFACGVAERESKQMADIIEDVLDLSRAGRQRLPVRSEPVDIGWVIARGQEAVGHLLTARGHRLSTVVEEGLPLVQADPSRMVQVVTNLLTNAAKFTAPAGNIVVSAGLIGDGICLRVRDDGVGIAASLLPRVFERYVQGPATVDQDRRGLGIGLALVKSIVEAGGGTVAAYSDGPGMGSEFMVLIPLQCRPSHPM
jgi:signal transduction histidine kinase